MTKINPFLQDLTDDLQDDLKFERNTNDFKIDTVTTKTTPTGQKQGALQGFGPGTAENRNFFNPQQYSPETPMAESRRNIMDDDYKPYLSWDNLNEKFDDLVEMGLGFGLGTVQMDYDKGFEQAERYREETDGAWLPWFKDTAVGDAVGSAYSLGMQGYGEYVNAVGWGVPSMLADMNLKIGGVDFGQELRSAIYFGNYKDPEERSGWEAAIGGLGMGLGMLRPIKQVGGVYQKAMVGTGNLQRSGSRLAGNLGMKTISEVLEGGARRVLGDNVVKKSILDQYKNKVTKTALAKAVAGLGDDALNKVVKIASNTVNRIGMKELTKIGTQGMTKMYDDVAEHLLKSGLIPGLTKSGAKELATELVGLSMKNSARNTLGVWSRAFQAMGLKEGAKGLAGQGLAAATNLFITGAMYDMGISGFKSLANLGVRIGHHLDPELIDYDKNWHKDPYMQEMHSNNIWGPNHSSFIGVMANAIKHGKHWAIMSPTHFVGGGRQKWLKEEGAQWWAATKKLWSKKPKKMSDDEAIAYVKGMENSMKLEGITLPDYIKTRVPNITNWSSAITGDQARSIIKETQNLAPKMIYNYFIPEIGKDIAGSMPRMLLGNILMNAPNIWEYSKGDYKEEMKMAAIAQGAMPREEKSFIAAAFDPKAYGNSIQEAVGNVVFAMSIAKHQQQLDMNRPKNGKWWSGGLNWKDGEIRNQPYSEAAKKQNNFRKAMNWFEMYDIMPNAMDILPKEIVRTALEGDGEWRPLMETLKDVVVEDPHTHAAAVARGGKEINLAYMEYIQKTEGRSLNAKEQNKLDMAMELIQVYAENGVLLGKEALRVMSPEKANEVIEKLNKLPGQDNWSGDAKSYSQYLVDKLYSQSADNYRVPIQNYLKQVADIFDVRATIDSKTGVLTMQKFNLDFLTKDNRPDGVSNDAIKQLMPAIRAFADKVLEGEKAGYVKIEGENVDVNKIVPSIDIMDKINELYKASVKDLNDKTYGKESDFFDKDILTSDSMGRAYKAIKDRELVQNVLHAFRPSTSRGKQFHTISDEALDVIEKEILRLRLDEDLPISISEGKAPQSTQKDNVVEFYENLKEVYRKVRGQNRSAVPGGGTKSKSIEMREIIAAKRNIEEILGDAFTNKDHVNNIKNEVNVDFFKRLGLEEFSNTSDTRLALSYLIYPDMNGRQLGDTSGPIAFAKIDKGGNVVLPEARKLFEIIKQTTDYKTNDITKEKVDSAESFYTNLELTVKSSGSGKFKFSTDADVFQDLLRKHGGEGVSDMLAEAQFRSNLGKVRDAKEAFQNGENINQEGDNVIQKIQQSIKDIDSNIEAGLLPKNQEVLQKKVALEKAEKLLTDLVQESRDLWEIIAEAQRTGDFSELIRMEQIDKSYSGFNRSLQKLLTIDIAKEGNINTEYMQEIGKLMDRAQEIRRNKAGNVDVNSLKRFYEEEMKNNTYNLPNFAEKMSVNITPTEFSQRYNIPSQNLDAVLNKVSETLNKSGRGEVVVQKDGSLKINMGGQKELVDGFYELFDLVKTSYQRKLRNYGDSADKIIKSEGDMLTDTYQMLTSHLLKRKIKKVTFNKGELELSEVYTQWDPEKGISGIDTYLGLKGRGWYEFGQEITFIDPVTNKERRGVVYADYAENLDVILESGKTMLVNRQQQIDFMQGKNMPSQLEAPISGEKYIKVDFGEGAEYMFHINSVVPRMKLAFEPGSPLYQRLAEILQINNSDVYKARFDKIVKDMTTDNPNVEQIKDNLQTIHNILNRVDNIIEGNKSNVAAKNDIKIRKLDTINRGKTLTDEQFTLAKEIYRHAVEDLGLKEFTEINRIYNEMGDKVSDKRLKSISIDDGGGNMLITNLMKSSYKRDKDAGRITQKEHDNMISHIESVLGDVSATDAPTFLTRDKFLLNLSQMGWRPEWFEFNNQGEITNIKIGAIKPKGAHVEVKDGKVVVSYNKTAFFYDPKLSDAMIKAGIDEVTFKSGQKVNSEYKLNKSTGEYEKRDLYMESKTDIGASIGEQIIDYIKSAGKNNIVEKKYDSYTVINASKEVKASVGANSGIHMSHDAGISNWLNVDANYSNFKKGILKIQDSPYNATDIMKQILKMDESLSDVDFSKQSYEFMIANDGLLLSPWMGDVASEKLFNYFYKGGKIATGTVENSSYNVMAPNLWTNFKDKRLPIRIGGTQRRYGENVANSFQLNQLYSKAGFINGKDNVADTGASFVFEHMFSEPGGGKYKADVLIGYDNTGKKPMVYVNGYEISADGTTRLLDRGVINRDYEGSSLRLKNDGLKVKENKKLYEDAVKELERIETLLSKDFGDQQGSANSYIGKATNGDVIKALRDNRNILGGNTYMTTLETRQPRNSMADVVINTIPYSSLDAKINKRGNQSNQNMIDLAKVQDADMDFDKSNSYLAAPSKYVREAVKNSGVEVSGDSYQFADALIKDIQVSLVDGTFKNSEIANWLQDHKGSELLRGRFVKMHNIMSYFMNAFPKGGNILTFKDINNQSYTVRFKGGAKYTTSADQVGHWVKIFIDNYKKSPKHGRQMTEDLVKKLMLGDSYTDPQNGGKRMYEGLFEVYNSKGEKVKDYIGTEYSDVREVIMDKMIKPLSSYLRFNRGEMQEGISSKSLTLKDIALGYMELRNNLNEGITSYDQNKGIFRQLSFYRTPGFERQIDIREGVKTLDLFISELSNSPFDRMMKNINEAYFQSLHMKPNKLNEFSDFIFKMEGEYIHRLTEKLGVDPADLSKFKMEYSEKFQNQLYDYVMTDFDLAKVTVLKQKLASLKDKKMWLESEPREQNSKGLNDLAERINLLQEGINDLQIRIQGDIQRSDNFKTFTGWEAGEGNLNPKGINRVIYTANGKVKEVIKSGQVNKLAIQKSDIIVENSRRFEVEHADKQEYLHARLQAFGHAEPTIKGAEMATDRDRSIVQSTFLMWKTQQDRLLKDFQKSQEEGNSGANVKKYVSDSKILLHNILNGLHSSQIQSPLQRKMLLWKMLSPELSSLTVSSRRTFDGQNFFGPKYLDNFKADKIVTSYLLEAGKGTGFQKIGQTGDNSLLTRKEALEWLTEIAQRQHLSYIGIKNPELNVMIDPAPTGNAYFKNKNNSRGRIRNSVYENQYMGQNQAQSDHALRVINDFVHGGRLLTPFDLRRLQSMVERGVAMDDIIEWNQGFDRTRKYGLWGKNIKQKRRTPTEEVIERIQHLKECLGE